MPGLGGKIAVAVFMPFVYGMDPVSGFAFLLGMHAVVHTGGSLPAILFGVPGTGPAAVTVCDGFPMSQKGEAGKALGAGLAASGLGGIAGAIMMALTIPVVRPLVLAFSPSEFFMMAIFGITLIALISGKSLMKGVMTGALGLLLAMVGEDPQSGISRFTFGQISLYEGIELIPVVVGVFALAEMMSLVRKGEEMSSGTDGKVQYTFRDVIRGMAELFNHWWLFLRCSVIGYIIGVIPGLGGEAAGWMCYGHAVQSSKDPESFGKGNVRGVIAPEAANNAKEGGALIPTVAFGVPGSSGMAVLLGAFIILGLTPGPMMLVNQLPTVWAMVWILVVSNLIAVVLFIFTAHHMAKVTNLKASTLVPFVFAMVMAGSYLTTQSWETMLVTVLMGFLGYAMKVYDWPRPPLLIGMVLGKIAEVNMHKSLTLWGPKFIFRPITFTLVLITLFSVLFPFAKKWWEKRKAAEELAQ